MLNIEKTQIMSDIVHGSIVYSGIEHAIISTPIFNRLHRISQNSLVFLTFPSNKVKRFEHSVGTMHLAGEIFYNSICNAKENVVKSFLACITDEIRAWRKHTTQSILPKELKNIKIEKILSMPYPQCALYHNYCPSNLSDMDKLAYFVAFQAIRIAGLLHDVGHLPYSHILEKALKNLFIDVADSKKIDESVKEEFVAIMSPFVNGQDEIHEEFGKLLIESIKQSILDNLTTKQKTDIAYFFIILTFDFAKKILSSNFTDNTVFSDMHLIVSGVVDADRLDYCSRDSFCAALDTDIFFYKRFINGYTLIRKVIGEDGYEHFFFTPPAKNLNMIHELIRKRYRIYSDINYHHRVHKHEIILEKVICQLGLTELEEMKEVEKLPNVLPLEVSSIWKLVKEIKSDNNWMEYQLMQLDDSWLDTLLKHKFFESYGETYLSIAQHGEDIKWNQFDELISTTKHYHSLIKRSSEFRLIDEEFYNLFLKTEWKIPSLSRKAKELHSSKYIDFLKGQRSFLFTYCINYLVEELTVEDVKTSFYQSVEDAMNQPSEIPILHCIVRSARFSHGLNTVNSPVFLVDNQGNEIRLEQLSTQRNTFLQEEALTPPFHLYYLPEYDGQNIPCEIDLQKLRTVLAQTLIKCLEAFVEKHCNNN